MFDTTRIQGYAVFWHGGMCHWNTIFLVFKKKKQNPWSLESRKGPTLWSVIQNKKSYKSVKKNEKSFHSFSISVALFFSHSLWGFLSKHFNCKGMFIIFLKRCKCTWNEPESSFIFLSIFKLISKVELVRCWVFYENWIASVLRKNTNFACWLLSFSSWLSNGRYSTGCGDP